MTGRLARRCLTLLHPTCALPAKLLDHELLSRFATARDEAAFTELVLRHGGLTRGAARRILGDAHAAEDVSQAAFLLLARDAGTRGWGNTVGPWLYAVAVRLALKERSLRGATRTGDAALARVVEPAPNPAACAEWADMLRVLDTELDALPTRLREPLVLCYLQGHTQDEAAGLLGWSLATLRRRIDRGRRLLHDRLARRGVSLAALGFGGLLADPTISSATATTTARAAVEYATSRTVPASVAGLLGSTSLGTRWLVSALSAALVAVGAVVGAWAGGAPPDGPPVAGTPKPPTAPPEQPPAATRDVLGDPLPTRAIARLGTNRFRSDTWVSQIAVVSDGKQILGFGQHSVILWDAATGNEVRRFGTPARRQRGSIMYSARAESFAVSPDGKLLAVGTADHSGLPCPVVLFDLPNGRTVGERPGSLADQQGSANPALAFVSPTLLASIGSDGAVRVWDVTAEDEPRSLDTSTTGTVSALVPLPNRKEVIGVGATKGGTGFWAVWDVGTGKVVHHEAQLPGAFVGTAATADGKTFAVTIGIGDAEKDGGRNEVRVYSSANWKEQVRWRAHTGRFPQRNAIAFSPNGKTIATSGADQKVRWWDAGTGKELGTALEPTPHANQLLYLDADTLVTFGFQHSVRLWNAATGKPKLESVGSESHLAAVAYSSDGLHVATLGGGGDSTVRVWNVATAKQVAQFQTAAHGVKGLQFSPDGKRIAWSHSDGSVRISDWAANREVAALRGHHQRVHCVAFSPDGKHLATGDSAGVVRVWDVASGKVLHTLQGARGHTSFVMSAAFGSDGRTLVSGSWDKSIRVWDYTTGQQVTVVEGMAEMTPAAREKPTGHAGPVTTVALSPGGQWIYSGSFDGTIRVWETKTGRFCATVKQTKPGSLFYHEVRAIAVSADGRRLAAALGDVWEENSVHVWDLPSGEKVGDLLGALPGHHGAVSAVAFSLDGRRLVSGSADTTALVWDASGLQAVQATGGAKEVASLWDDLDSPDAARAYTAACRGASHGDAAVAVLKVKLKPLAAADESKVGEWLRQLGSADFDVRERANRALAALGPAAEPRVAKVAGTSESPEVRARATALLKGYAAVHRRPARALEVLEVIGTPDAKRLLSYLAGGAPGTRLAVSAADALKRLEARK